MRLARFTIVSLLVGPAAAGAQTLADGVVCDHVGDARYPDARATVVQGGRPSDARGLFFVGCLALADEKPNDAANAFERVVKAEDGNAVAHFWLGRAYGDQAQRANVFRQASLAHKTKVEFDRAVQLDPEYLDARIGLMEYYSHAPGIMGGSKEKARAQADEIRKRNPWRGGFAAADLAGREKDWPRATREFEQLAKTYPDSVQPLAAMTSAYLQQKRYVDAFAAVDRLSAMPNATAASYLVGRVAAESGEQLDRGERALKSYLATAPKLGDPQPAAAHYRLGMIAERRGQVEVARGEYRTAIALDPKLTNARDALGRLK